MCRLPFSGTGFQFRLLQREERVMAEEDEAIDVLLERARGDKAALERLLERYRAFLLVEARRQIDSKHTAQCDASGIVQQTLKEAWEGFGRFAGTTEPKFSAWLKEMHRHNILDCLRRYRPEAEIPRDPPADRSSPSQRLIKGEKALRLAELLASLPEAQGEAVRLRHLEGWSIDQIARHLDRSEAATAGLIKRGLQGLRGKMSEESWM